MSAQPVELFSLRLLPGEPVNLDPTRDLIITSVCFADVELVDGKEVDIEDPDSVPSGQTTLIKVHHIPLSPPEDLDDDELLFDDDSDDSDKEDDDDEEDEEVEEKEAEEAEEVVENGTLSNKEGALMQLGEDDSEDEEMLKEIDELEEKVVTFCRLVTGRTEQVTTSLQISGEELVSFSLAGKNARAVDLLGSYVSYPQDYDLEPNSEEEYDSEEGDDEEDSDDEEEDDSELGGRLINLEDMDSEDLARLLAMAEDDEDDEDSDDDDEDDDDEEGDSEVQEFGDESGADRVSHKELAALLAGNEDLESDSDDDDFEEAEGDEDEDEEQAANVKVSGKKRRATEDEDSSMQVDKPVTTEELKAAAAAEGIDLNGLSKNQRKRLNKKLKSQGGLAVAGPDETFESAADASSASKKSAAAAATPAKKEKAAPVTAESSPASKKTTLGNGLVIEDKKVGTGPAAKPGMKIGMRYVGKFTSGKIFDSNTKGAPFAFRLGKGEVIKGWDEGVKGMKVGSERRITVPPALGYGSRKTGPIPANSTLVFDVKLVSMK